MFRLLGRGILDGKTIYVDLFDHKSPILFYIEAIGEFFGKFGVWGLQCIFGIATICVLYKTGKEIQTNNSSAQFVISFLASLLVFFYTFESGNISEEFSLLFIASSFLLFGKYGGMCKDSAKDHPVSFAFLHGMCIAILAFIRLNNALSNCAGLLAIALFLVKEKKWKNLFQNICYGILGVAVVVVPIVLYFTAKNALKEMLYCTFTYNFLYAGNVGHSSSPSSLMIWLLWFSPAILACVVLVFGLISKRFHLDIMDGIIISILIVNIVCMAAINLNIHYFTLFVPVFYIVLCRYLSISKRSVPLYAVLFLIALFAFNDSYRFYSTFRSYYITQAQQIKYDIISKDFAVIPDSEKDSVIGFNIPSSYYLCANILPCYKYYTQQEWWAINDSTVLTDFFDWAYRCRPKWFAIAPNEDNPEVLTLLNSHYECVASDEYVVLFHVK